jgi:hypothetical protein
MMNRIIDKVVERYARKLAPLTTNWAYPDSYEHVAMRQPGRADILCSGAEVSVYDRLRERTMELQKHLPAYIKELIGQQRTFEAAESGRDLVVCENADDMLAKLGI